MLNKNEFFTEIKSRKVNTQIFAGKTNTLVPEITFQFVSLFLLFSSVAYILTIII